MRAVILVAVVGFCAATIPTAEEVDKKVLDAGIDFAAFVFRVDREVMTQIYGIVNENSPDTSVIKTAVTSIAKEVGSKYSKILAEINAKIDKKDLDKIKATLKSYNEH